MKISVLVPSRGRPDWCARMAGSALLAAKGAVEIFVGYDEDDDHVAEYANLPTAQSLIMPEGMGVSFVWNELAQKAIEGGADILLMGNDDQLYVTMGWDEKFREAARSFEDDIYVLWCNDGINGERQCAVPAISRKWYETLGYFVPDVGFKFFYNDTWVADIGKRLGRMRYIPDCLVQHLHFSAGGLNDATTMRNRVGNVSMEDRRLWAQTDTVRAEHAAKLREVME